MSWRRSHSSRGGQATGQEWVPEDVAALERAVGRCPTVHGARLWSVTVRGRTALLREDANLPTQRADPQGRLRRLGRGAALTNLVLGVRGSGWTAEVDREPQPHPGEVVAVVRGARRRTATAVEMQRFRAIVRQTNHRRAFDPEPLTHLSRETLVAASRSPAVHPCWVAGQRAAEALSDLLVAAQRSLRQEGRAEQPRTRGGDPAGTDAGAWTGLLPDDPRPEVQPLLGAGPGTARETERHRLAACIAEEAVLVLSTPADTAEDLISVGESMQAVWLSATSLGLVTSVITGPLHEPEARGELREALGESGHPQVLMRFGHPTAVPGPRRP